MHLKPACLPFVPRSDDNIRVHVDFQLPAIRFSCAFEISLYAKLTAHVSKREVIFLENF